MRNNQFLFVDKLIEYANKFHRTFPVSMMKDMNEEQIIKKIQICLDNNKIYKESYVSINKEKIIENEIDLVDLFDKIRLTMSEIGYDYNDRLSKNREVAYKRKKGMSLSFKEHLQAFIFIQICNNRWGDKNVIENIENLRLIFHDYEKEYLKDASPITLMKELKKIHCTNCSTSKHLQSLKYNINQFEKIEKLYGSIDNFLNKHDTSEIISMLSYGKYKMLEMGKNNIVSYLKRVGLDICSCNLQLKRIFGSNRLGISKHVMARQSEIVKVIEYIANKTNYEVNDISDIISQYCMEHCANICTVNPNCHKCKLKKYCNYNK